MDEHGTVAVAIPCHNEAPTVAKVVGDFRRALPGAQIHVFDNASTDGTADIARAAGAHVHAVHAKGKGHVVRSMFREIDADVLVMVDGDDTYPADMAGRLVAAVATGGADMAVATRLESHDSGAFRRFHGIGNRLVRGAISSLFGVGIADALSGYRAFSRRFAHTMPVLSQGFEIETEMTVFALSHGLALQEIPVSYGTRPEGSHSKLNTYRDGARVLLTIVSLYKDHRPLRFFGAIALACVLVGIGAGALILAEFARTGLVTHPSTAVLAAASVLAGMLSMATGLVLHTVNRRSMEIMRLLTDQVLAPRARRRRVAQGAAAGTGARQPGSSPADGTHR